MSIEMQKEAASLGAFLEYPFNATLPPSPEWGGGSSSMEAYVKALRAVGPEHCILSSDLGQPMNPVHTDGLIGFVQQLSKNGFTQAEIDRMAKQNPAKFLGLE
jgi:predicted metal-dependent phosphotriesterase family hydrolase